MHSNIEEHKAFNMPSKSVLQKAVKNLLSKLFPMNSDDLEFVQEVCMWFRISNLNKKNSFTSDEVVQHTAKKQHHILRPI